MRHQYQSVTTTRSVRVERVPDGTPIELAAGTKAQIAQDRGSAFTLLVEGQMVRLNGADADADVLSTDDPGKVALFAGDALLELLDIPYTGSDPATLSLALAKALGVSRNTLYRKLGRL